MKKRRRIFWWCFSFFFAEGGVEEKKCLMGWLSSDVKELTEGKKKKVFQCIKYCWMCTKWEIALQFGFSGIFKNLEKAFNPSLGSIKSLGSLWLTLYSKTRFHEHFSDCFAHFKIIWKWYKCQTFSIDYSEST